MYIVCYRPCVFIYIIYFIMNEPEYVEMKILECDQVKYATVVNLKRVLRWLLKCSYIFTDLFPHFWTGFQTMFYIEFFKMQINKLNTTVFYSSISWKQYLLRTMFLIININTTSVHKAIDIDFSLKRLGGNKL